MKEMKIQKNLTKNLRKIYKLDNQFQDSNRNTT